MNNFSREKKAPTHQVKCIIVGSGTRQQSHISVGRSILTTPSENFLRASVLPVNVCHLSPVSIRFDYCRFIELDYVPMETGYMVSLRPTKGFGSTKSPSKGLSSVKSPERHNRPTNSPSSTARSRSARDPAPSQSVNTHIAPRSHRVPTAFPPPSHRVTSVVDSILSRSTVGLCQSRL